LTRRLPLAVWLVFAAACAWVAAHARYTADMSAFLPDAATPLQRLLVAELREGVTSRLILIGIEGAPAERLAAVSRALAKRLEGRPEFAYLANGEARLAAAERDFLFANRYLLSPGVDAQRFEPAALAAALERGYEALASPAGPLVRRYLPADPTGELLRLAAAFDAEARPATVAGVWMSRDERTALALVQTAAAGFDLDAQQANLALIAQAFADARAEAGAETAVLRLTGPAVFAVSSRAAIRGDVERLSVLAAALVAGLLLAVFRSIAVVATAFVPVASGILAGIAAVALGFGTVHGITLGFGVTLIGETVDYAIYFFGQRQPGEPPERALAGIWPTLRLGTVVSVASYCAMLLSGFAGLAQLGAFSVVGLVAALAATRWVLPALAGRGAAPPRGDAIARVLPRWRLRPGVRLAALVVVIGAAALAVARQQPIWDDDPARLNPITDAERALDQRLREALGAPDARWLLLVSAASEEAALEACEALEAPLAGLVAGKALAGFDSPARVLPSRRTQLARRDALPDAARLRENVRRVVADSPFRPGMFEPFVRDVAAAKAAPPLDRARLRGTAFGLKVDSLLVQRDGRWYAFLPLRGVADPAALADRVAKLGAGDVMLLDIRRESAALLGAYRERTLALWGLGLGLIVAVLFFQLRSAARVLRVAVPIAAAVAATVAILLVAGDKLTLFHLVAALLVVGVGSNYALFFERAPADEAERRATALAVIVCAATTILVFALLTTSQVPVLRMIGSTVAVGAVLSLLFSAFVARQPGTGRPVC
jgi:predicted exporter